VPRADHGTLPGHPHRRGVQVCVPAGWLAGPAVWQRATPPTSTPHNNNLALAGATHTIASPPLPPPHSEADRASKFVALADEAYCIGPAPARDSYLRGDVILEVAARAGVDAIHPGERCWHGALAWPPGW
jgi:hypothetical protein